MKKNSINDQVLQISLCRKGSWDNSGLPNALNQSLKERFGLNFIFSDSQNLKSTKENYYKEYINTLFSCGPQGFVFKNNYLSGIPKLVFLDSSINIDEIKKAPYWDDIIGFLSLSSNTLPISNKPVFQSTDVLGISDFLYNFINNVVRSRPLYGLALVGGKSQRMKEDKGALDYFGKAQGQYVHEILSGVCEKVYISLREEQASLPYLEGLEDHFLYDRFLNMGPMGGLLTAFKKHPEASWLVLACDLPYVSKEILVSLVEGRNYFKKATCFKNPEKGWAEPLCTIYEPGAVRSFHQYLSLGVECPRKVLMNMPHELLEVSSDEVLQNINTPEGYKLTKLKAQQQILEREGGLS